jgi:hypothetical protein
VPTLQQHVPDTDQPSDGLRDDPSPAAAGLATQAAAMFGPATLGVLHYGSRAQGRATRPDSAFDFFVIVSEYADAYNAAAPALGGRSRARRAALLALVLPPNALALRRSGPFGDHTAKCLVLSLRDFRRECSAAARDHFVQTRMAQRVTLAWARDEDSAAAVLDVLRGARERTFEWARSFLAVQFDLAMFCRTLIEIPFSHEIRAEGKDHPGVLFAAQRSLLAAIYGPVLARLVASGRLLRDGDQYRQREAPGPIIRLRVRAYFARSKLRTTLRLLKHPFLYEGWLEYILRKIDRSAGQHIELTERERRWPLIFLWPRAVRYLRTRPQRER